MPRIARIAGCVIRIHSGREHPPPHVHVVRNGEDVVVNLLTLQPYGRVPFRVPMHVRRFLRENQARLLELWDGYHGD